MQVITIEVSEAALRVRVKSGRRDGGRKREKEGRKKRERSVMNILNLSQMVK